MYLAPPCEFVHGISMVCEDCDVYKSDWYLKHDWKRKFTSYNTDFVDFRFRKSIVISVISNKISGRVYEIWQQLVTPRTEIIPYTYVQRYKIPSYSI